MNNITVYIIVEGLTEQTFVRDVLAPVMKEKEIYLIPTQIGRPGHKGGNIRFSRAMPDIKMFLEQQPDVYVSTMFDYFRIDNQWPGIKTVKERIDAGSTLSAVKKGNIVQDHTFEEVIKNLSNSLSESTVKRRFIPYIEMHEFEALLFSSPDILAEQTQIPISKINSIITEHGEPEEINSEPTKAPSKQLEKLYSLKKEKYKKVGMGKSISEAIGIGTIRKQCPHFNEWLNKLEALKTT